MWFWEYVEEGPPTYLTLWAHLNFGTIWWVQPLNSCYEWQNQPWTGSSSSSSLILLHNKDSCVVVATAAEATLKKKSVEACWVKAPPSSIHFLKTPGRCQKICGGYIGITLGIPDVECPLLSEAQLFRWQSFLFTGLLSDTLETPCFYF